MLKRILNVPEQITYRRLVEVCTRRKATLHAKVRLADVLPIEGSGISRELYDFALTSHYDFVISDRGQQPLFAVEFDGPQHRLFRQAERDVRKNELCRRFDLVLFRVDSSDLIRTESRLDRLTDLIEGYFDRNGPVADNSPGEWAQAPSAARHRTLVLNSNPSCPSCQAEMVVKNGRYGPFYSCTRYPDCKGSSDLPRPSLQLPASPESAATATSLSRNRQSLLIGIALGFAALSLIIVLIFSMRSERQVRVDRPAVEDHRIDKSVDLDGATDRQIKLLGLLIRRREWSEKERDFQVESALGYRKTYSELSKREASKLITSWDDRKK